MYAFGVLMLRLASDLPSVLYIGTERQIPLNAHVRVKLLGEVWEGRRGALADDGQGAHRPGDLTPYAWKTLPGADTRGWEGLPSMLASFGVLALRCTEFTPQARPPMADVVAGLESLLAGPEPPLGVAPEPPLSRSGDCRICCEVPRDTEFLPCHHMVACSPCV